MSLELERREVATLLETRPPVRGQPINLETAWGIQEALGEEPRLIQFQTQSIPSRVVLGRSLTLFRTLDTIKTDLILPNFSTRQTSIVTVGPSKDNPELTAVYYWHREESDAHIRRSSERLRFSAQKGRFEVIEQPEPSLREVTSSSTLPRLFISYYHGLDLSIDLDYAEGKVALARNAVINSAILLHIATLPSFLRDVAYRINLFDQTLTEVIMGALGKSSYLNPDIPPYLGLEPSSIHASSVKVFKQADKWKVEQSAHYRHNDPADTLLSTIREEVEQALAI